MEILLPVWHSTGSEAMSMPNNAMHTNPPMTSRFEAEWKWRRLADLNRWA